MVNDELGGSALKAAAELAFSAYGDSFFHGRQNFGYASVRACNVIGGGDWSEERIVLDCLCTLCEGQPVVFATSKLPALGNVLEPLVGYLVLAAALGCEPQKFSGGWNFGPNSEAVRSVHDLVHGIVGARDSGQIKIQPSTCNPYEAGLLYLNCDMAHHRLGWKHRWDFDRTVQEMSGCSLRQGSDCGERGSNSSIYGEI